MASAASMSILTRVPCVQRSLIGEGYADPCVSISDGNRPYLRNVLFLNKENNEMLVRSIPDEFRYRLMTWKNRPPEYTSFRPPKEVDRYGSVLRVPRVYRIDMASDEDILERNEQKSWCGALYDDGSPYKYPRRTKSAAGVVEYGKFFSPFPGEHFGTKDDLNTEYRVDFMFDLTAKHLGLEDKPMVTHREFFNKLFPNASPSNQPHIEDEIIIPLSQDQIRKAIIGSAPIVDLARKDYHCLPLMIRVKDVYSTFPIALNCVLRSSLSKSSPKYNLFKDDTSTMHDAKYVNLAMKTRQTEIPYVNWSMDSGISSSAQHTNQFVVQPYQKTSNLHPDDGIVYAANSTIINSPDFSRYITVDFRELDKTLEGITFMDEQNSNNQAYYRIPMPPLEDVRIPNMLSWFYIEHAPLIFHVTENKKTELQDTKLSKQANMLDCSSTPHVLAPKIAFDDVLDRRKEVFNKDHLLMNMDELHLAIRPVKGASAGWSEYGSVQQSLWKALPLDYDRTILKLTVTLSMTFEPYNVTKGSSRERSVVQQRPISNYQYYNNWNSAQQQVNDDANRGQDVSVPIFDMQRLHNLHGILGTMNMASGSTAAAANMPGGYLPVPSESLTNFGIRVPMFTGSDPTRR